VDGADGPGPCAPLDLAAPSCGADEALFPGETTCRRVGAACSADEWAEALPATGVLYVRAGAGPGGSGTRAAPFGRIRDAVAAAAAGDTVALGRGAYDEVLTVRSNVTLRGACVAETILSFSIASDGAGVVQLTGSTPRLENLTITGPRPGLLVEGGADAQLEDVLIDGASLYGLGVFGSGRLTAQNLVVRNTHGSALDGSSGRGITLESGGTLVLAQAVVERNRETGALAVGDGTLMRLTNVVFRETRAFGPESDGFGAAFGARVEGTGVLVERNPGIGVYVDDEGSTVELTHAVFRHNALTQVQVGLAGALRISRGLLTAGGEDAFLVGGTGSQILLEHVLVSEQAGRGINIQDSASAEIRRALFRGNDGTALRVAGPEGPGAPAASLVAGDVVVASNAGRGLLVQDGGAATMTRALLDDNEGTGVSVLSPDSTATLEDLVIQNTRRAPADQYGRGLEVGDGAQVAVTRMLLERNREVAALLHAGAPTLSDVTIRDTQIDGLQSTGRGLEIQGGAEAMVERLEITDARGTALLVTGEGTRATLVDLRLTDTEGAGPILPLGGHALTVNAGATAQITRALLERNREATVAAFGDGTVLTLEDLVARHNLERSCAADRCMGFGGGIGVGTYMGAHVQAHRFSISDGALCGVQLGGGLMDLLDGEIVRNPIGANVQTEGFDYARITEDVEFRDNDRNVDAMMLPLPEAVAPAPEM